MKKFAVKTGPLSILIVGFIWTVNAPAGIVRMKHCFHNDVLFTEIARTASCEAAHLALPPHAPRAAATAPLPKNERGARFEFPGSTRVETHLCRLHEKDVRYIED